MKVSDRLHAAGRSTLFQLDGWMGKPQSRSGRGGEDKNIIAPDENRFSVVQTVP
jgi:hypothetical protein